MAKIGSTYTSVAGLNKALRKLPPLASAELRDASQEIASFVASDARGLTMRVGGVARQVAPTIRATRDRVPVVKMGGSNRLPSTNRSRNGSRQTVGDVIWGAEYGGNRASTGRSPKGHTTQFKPWRGSSTGAGYFMWPTIRGDNRQIHDAYSEALKAALVKLR